MNKNKYCQPDTYMQPAKPSCLMLQPCTDTISLINLSQTVWIPPSDRTSKCSSFNNAGRISIASISRQSSIYNSLRTDFSEFAKLQMPTEVSREHWLRLIDVIDGAEETSAFSPSSERRYAPFNDTVVRAGRLLSEWAKVAERV